MFYWFGAYYSNALLFQAILMIGVQLVLLKVALDNRAPAGIRDGVEHAPFSGQTTGILGTGFSRPYNFWQWRANRPYVFSYPTPHPPPRVFRIFSTLETSRSTLELWLIANPCTTQQFADTGLFSPTSSHRYLSSTSFSAPSRARSTTSHS